MPMFEVTNRIYLDADGKVTADPAKAVRSVAPGRITLKEAEELGLTAETTPAVVPDP